MHKIFLSWQLSQTHLVAAVGCHWSPKWDKHLTMIYNFFALSPLLNLFFLAVGSLQNKWNGFRLRLCFNNLYIVHEVGWEDNFQYLLLFAATSSHSCSCYAMVTHFHLIATTRSTQWLSGVNHRITSSSSSSSLGFSSSCCASNSYYLPFWS